MTLPSPNRRRSGSRNGPDCAEFDQSIPSHRNGLAEL
jgi:hypothetical protein